MQLLNPSNYTSLQRLLSPAMHDLAPLAVARGSANGQVYANNADEPQLALILPHWGRLYVVGRASEQAACELRELLEGVIRPSALAADSRWFTVMYPPEWEDFVKPALGHLPSVPAERQYYRWMGEPFEPLPPPEEFDLVPADAALMARADVADLHLLAEEMASERASVEDFLARSFGVVALRGRELAGGCLSEYNWAGRCEVGIASLEPFQRLGLATAMGRVFLHLAQMQGIGEVGWHCWKKNVPSASAARKIGLEWIADYPVYVGWYNEEDAPHR